jgi:N utilization substance protein B
MFSRRLLRIKVLQTLYSFHKVDGKTYISSEKELLHSIEKSYELYHLLLLLMTEVADYAESKIEQAKQKRIPTREDLHPNTRFIDNRVVHQIRNNTGFNKFLGKTPLSWVQYPEIVRKLYQLITDSVAFQEFMTSEEHSYKSEKRLLEYIYSDIVMNYEDLYLNLEEQSIFWTDDVDYIIKMIIRTIRKFSEDDPDGGQLLPRFKDDDDLAYCKKLLRTTIRNEKEYLEMVETSANNWELERIAFIDSLILRLAIAEAIEFKSIPVKVTINEFIEIAKAYSTQKSSQFINGILDNIINNLKADGRIAKSGRGLIGEV